MRGARLAFSLATFALPGLLFAGVEASSAPDAIDGGSAVVTDGPAAIETYGQQNTFATYTAWDMQPIDSTVTYELKSTAGGHGITRTAGTPFFRLPVHVPNGALVSSVEVNYCDTGAGVLQLYWFQQVKNAQPVVTSLLLSAGTPGCVVQTANFVTPQTIDNNANSYTVEFYMSSTDESITVLSTRVAYVLQVSPSPAVATFTDVPTGHPFFRFVEALYAAGITGGCGGGLYCVNDPVTRGQMAVFLSIALGLHFPN